MSFDKFGQPENLDEWSNRIGDIMDEMLSRSFVGFRGGCAVWRPDANVYETEEGFAVCVDLAGVEQQQIDVRCHESNRLTISGVRGQPRPPARGGSLSVLAMEISEGAFRCEIDLPEHVDVARVEASYTKGFLWIALPRARKA